MSIWTILSVILLIAWLGGFTVFRVAGGLIYLLLVFAVVSLVLHFSLSERITGVQLADARRRWTVSVPNPKQLAANIRESFFDEAPTLRFIMGGAPLAD